MIAAVRRGEVLLHLRLPPQPRAVRVPPRFSGGRRCCRGGGVRVHRRRGPPVAGQRRMGSCCRTWGGKKRRKGEHEAVGERENREQRQLQSLEQSLESEGWSKRPMGLRVLHTRGFGRWPELEKHKQQWSKVAKKKRATMVN